MLYYAGLPGPPPPSEAVPAAQIFDWIGARVEAVGGGTSQYYARLMRLVGKPYTKGDGRGNVWRASPEYPSITAEGVRAAMRVLQRRFSGGHYDMCYRIMTPGSEDTIEADARADALGVTPAAIAVWSAIARKEGRDADSALLRRIFSDDLRALLQP